MSYVVMKGAKYAAQSGRKASYTTRIEYARRYATLDEAQRDCCGNEVVMHVEGTGYEVRPVATLREGQRIRSLSGERSEGQ